MKTYFDCIPCFIRQVLDSVRLTTDDQDVHIQVLRRALRLAADMDLTQSPPAMAQQIHRFIRELTANPDPYIEIKNRFNKIALEMYPDLIDLVDKSHNPLETAVRLAMAGNIIDFGVNSGLEEQHLKDAITESLDMELDTNALEDLKIAADQAETILYIADNAGEIVFDRILIEKLPTEKITCVVRGGPILNDATIEDAQIAGITDIAETIDNGSDAPGTILDTCSQDFRRRFSRADLIIAKGQGNYETLSDIDKDIFFILRAKCPVIAKHLDCRVGAMILSKTKTLDRIADLKEDNN